MSAFIHSLSQTTTMIAAESSIVVLHTNDDNNKHISVGPVRVVSLQSLRRLSMVMLIPWHEMVGIGDISECRILEGSWVGR
jgi:hypothetical protein